jgi:hypothetical protein
LVDTTTTNAGIRITRIKPQPDGSVLLEFPVIAGRWYRVKFSQNLSDWFASQVPIKAGGTRMQWFDKGPPFSSSHPKTLPSGTGRFYLVEEIAP